jgi:antitoxin ParD1/3/4
MQVQLTAEMEAFVQILVARGLFLSPDDAVQNALNLLKDQFDLYEIKRERLKGMLAVGIEQLDRGERIDGDTVFGKLHEKIQRDSGEGS